jgi:hypothetical protein
MRVNGKDFLQCFANMRLPDCNTGSKVLAAESTQLSTKGPSHKAKEGIN